MTAVRPAFRKALRIVLPIVIVVAALRLWGDYEVREFTRVVQRVEALAPQDTMTQVDDAARFYAAAAMLASVPTNVPAAQTASVMRAALDAGRPPDAASAQAVAEALRVNEITLEMVDRAATMRLTSIPARYSVLHSVPVWLTVTPVMSLRTLDHAANARVRPAVQSLVSALAFLRGASADSRSLAATQQAFVVRGLVADLAVLLERLRLSDPELDDLEIALERVFAPDDLQRLIAGQTEFRYRNISVFQAAGLYGDLTRPARYRVATSIARSAEQALDVAGRPWPDKVRGMSAIPEWTIWFAPQPLRYLGSATRSLLQDLAENYAAGVADVHIGQTAIAIERYRRANGRLPDSLRAVTLTGGKSVDPFTGQSLIYRLRPGGYVLYSVGRDGRDDAGDIGPPTKAIAPGTQGRDIGVFLREG